MDDAYTCKCGSTEWIIWEDHIECAKCDFEYRLFTIIPVDDFNERIRKEKIK